jgi:glutamine synthetase
MLAQELDEFTAILEPAKENGTLEKTVKELLVKTLEKHDRIIFNGDGYAPEWIPEAIRRGLPNYTSTVDALPHYTDEKNVAMFEKFGVYTSVEVNARKEILLEAYSKQINIEALTMIDMATKQLLPAALSYTKELCDSIAVKKTLGIDSSVEEKLANKITALSVDFSASIEKLSEKVSAAQDMEVGEAQARVYRDSVFVEMGEMRKIADEIEVSMPSAKWPIPAYSEMIFNV